MIRPNGKLVTIKGFSIEALNQSVMDYAAKHKPKNSNKPESAWLETAKIGDGINFNTANSAGNFMAYAKRRGFKVKSQSFMKLGARGWQVQIIDIDTTPKPT